MNQSINRKTLTLLSRCPQCNQKPKNMANKNIGYRYGCLCRVALAQAKFSIYQSIAADNWNRVVMKYWEAHKNQITKTDFEEDA